MRIELSRRNKRNKGNLCSDARSLSAISAISAGLKTCQLVGFVLFPKEIKEIFIPLGAALSAISAISAGHYYLMRIVFYCPTEIKEFQVSDVALGRPSASKLQGQELQKIKVKNLLAFLFLRPTTKKYRAIVLPALQALLPTRSVLTPCFTPYFIFRNLKCQIALLTSPQKCSPCSLPFNGFCLPLHPL